MKKGIFIVFALVLGLFATSSVLLAQPKVVAHRGYWNVNGKWNGNASTTQ